MLSLLRWTDPIRNFASTSRTTGRTTSRSATSSSETTPALIATTARWVRVGVFFFLFLSLHNDGDYVFFPPSLLLFLSLNQAVTFSPDMLGRRGGGKGGDNLASLTLLLKKRVFVCACVCASLPDPNAAESRQEEQIDGGAGGGVPASQGQDICARCERALFFFFLRRRERGEGERRRRR